VTAAERAFAVVAGGGTAGHVLPALAIAESIVARGHAVEDVHLAGTVTGIERRLVPPTGHPLILSDVVGLQRRLDRRNLLLVPKLVAATLSMVRHFGRIRPRVVVSVGGYASLPAVLAATLRRVPLVVVSYDARPGLASRLAARVATACAVAFPEVHLPRARLTGAPVRRAVLDVDPARDRATARAALGLPADRFVLVAVGGSLGSGLLNRAVAGFVAAHAGRSDLAVRHVVGERFQDEGAAARDGADGILYQVIGFEDRMPLAYAAADLVLARAGASTVAELATVGVASVLVPWSGAAEDHQTANARSLSDAGAAILLPEDGFDAGALTAAVDRLAAHPESIAAMAAAARRAGERHRSGDLASLVEEVAAR
jgi:undecaprenyldiphospho-muramoylpentapeptide beta-N-acetylglucosaminyltransferase